MKDSPSTPVAIVGGAGEARRLAAACPGAPVRLPDGERVPRRWPGAVSVGPVTAEWLAGTGAGALVIAAHPFDTATAASARLAARTLAIPFVTILRPPWRRRPGERWHRAAHADDLARVIPPGGRVFAATGREDLAALRRLRAEVHLRQIGGADPAPGIRVHPGAPPFTPAGEAALFRRLGIDWLVLRNAGGAGARPKLDAARGLGLNVAMIERPPRPSGPVAGTVEEALKWLRHTTRSPVG
ncbi:precorrin-6A/cobalt-precorrin-6A reductase [Roseivivax sediminis]|uniref:Precorrin-6A/cobalt-precorrin-6A reductase n=1 Tax=Roseivivax sediminis TaxID=936889 RepID=A0A1I1Y114_9RHOB|nr:precorrin-6A/cobalt-precorrin-6A reductase [Roseivivax sediminis]SFE13385.1 precorrin-6A/cobalt-precorrin-6A reductase [Roseivivax sediminis]